MYLLILKVLLTFDLRAMITFKELMEEVKEPFFNLVPGLLSVWEVAPSLICLIPGLLRIVIRILEWSYSTWMHQTLDGEFDASIEVHKRNERKQGNHVYRVISWYIIKGMNDNSLNIKKLVCTGSTIHHENDEDYFSCDESIHTADYTIMPDEDYFIDIAFKDKVFRAHHYKIGLKQDNYVLKLYADKIEDLKEFEEHCLKEHRQFCLDRGQDSYKYCEWMLEEEEWTKRDIETVKSWENIFIPAKQKADLIDKLDVFVSSKENYKHWGIPYKLGLVFHGVPGCGKTSTIYAIANYLQRNIYFLKLDLFKNNQQLLRAARDIPKDAIVVLEDIDAHRMTHSRIIPDIRLKSECEDTTNDSEEKSSDSDTDGDEDEDDVEIRRISRIAAKLAPDVSPSLGSGKTIDSLLELFDGYNYLPGAIVVITTNHIEKLDSALIRPGRMDHHCQFLNADLATINQILDFFYNTNTGAKSGEESGETSGKASGEESGETSGDEFGEASGETSGEASGDESGEASGEASGDKRFTLVLPPDQREDTLNKVTTSEIINSIVLPNIQAPEKALMIMKERLGILAETK